MRNGRDRRSENPRSATRGKSACFWLGPISGSHQGPQPERLHSEAGYMAAPERFAQPSDSPLAPRAPSIHGTSATCCNARAYVRFGGEAGIWRRPGWSVWAADDPSADLDDSKILHRNLTFATPFR